MIEMTLLDVMGVGLGGGFGSVLHSWVGGVVGERQPRLGVVDFDQLGEVGGELGIIDCHSTSIMIFKAASTFFRSLICFSSSCRWSFQ